MAIDELNLNSEGGSSANIKQIPVRSTIYLREFMNYFIISHVFSFLFQFLAQITNICDIYLAITSQNKLLY